MIFSVEQAPATLRSGNATKDDVLEHLRSAGRKTRAEIEEHFGPLYTRSVSHLRELRLDGLLFISEWRLASEGWVPVYATKAKGDQVPDAPEPVARRAAVATMVRRNGQTVAVDDEDGVERTLPQQVVQDKGVRPEDVALARRRAEFGPWAGL